MRKTTEITLIDRDTEKTFVIREMSCIQSQAWLLEAANVLVRCGLLKVADGAGGENFSFEAVVKTLMEGGLTKLTGIDTAGAQELTFKLLGCCSYKLGAASFPLNTQENIEQYVEDLKTLFKLEFEALKLNFDFFTGASNSNSQDKPQKELKKQVTKAQG